MKSLGFDLSYFRLPIVDEKAPRDIDFDDALNAMRQTDPDSACIFNCQMGKGRTTTGMILACLLKDILFGDRDKKYFKMTKLQQKNSLMKMNILRKGQKGDNTKFLIMFRSTFLESMKPKLILITSLTYVVYHLKELVYKT